MWYIKCPGRWVDNRGDKIMYDSNTNDSFRYKFTCKGWRPEIKYKVASVNNSIKIKKTNNKIFTRLQKSPYAMLEAFWKS